MLALVIREETKPKNHIASCQQETWESTQLLETGGMATALGWSCAPFLFLMLEVFLVSTYLFRRMGTMRTLNTTWWWSEVPFAGSSLSH